MIPSEVLPWILQQDDVLGKPGSRKSRPLTPSIDGPLVRHSSAQQVHSLLLHTKAIDSIIFNHNWQVPRTHMNRMTYMRFWEFGGCNHLPYRFGGLPYKKTTNSAAAALTGSIGRRAATPV